jgi:hypothetical protein
VKGNIHHGSTRKPHTPSLSIHKEPLLIVVAMPPLGAA